MIRVATGAGGAVCVCLSCEIDGALWRHVHSAAPGRTACAMLHNEHVLYVSMCDDDDDDARDGSCDR